MEAKFAMVATALLVVAGAAVAFGAWGMWGESPQENGITDEVRIAFMKAVHEGDYATAKSLSEKYGVGGWMMKMGSEQMFSLRYQIRKKMDAGDYAGALELQKQLRQLAQEQMQKKKQEMKEKFGDEAGRAFRMGFRAGRTGRCPIEHVAAPPSSLQ
ncbi:MAG: hypothetical protein N3E51_05135 [Candidatus Micrarchaeota archaeon]|nr:hypothetical protein [Candidatus Micrarchaeota archaeon]